MVQQRLGEHLQAINRGIEKGIVYELTRYGIDELDCAITDEEAHGLIKVLIVLGKDNIIGATIVVEYAAELIVGYITAMHYNLGMNKILSTIHIYPTFTEATLPGSANHPPRDIHPSDQTIRTEIRAGRNRRCHLDPVFWR